MALEVLVSSDMVSSNVQIYRTIDTSLVQIGSDIIKDAADDISQPDPLGPNIGVQRNTVAYIWGKIWAVIPDGLWVYDPQVPSDDWQQVYGTFADSGNSWNITQTAYVGYWAVDGVPYVIAILSYNVNVARLIGWNLLTDSLGWDVGVTISGGNGFGALMGVEFYNGKYYISHNNALDIFDAVTGTRQDLVWSPAIVASGERRSGALCAFNGTVYGLGLDESNDQDFLLYQASGGVFFGWELVETSPIAIVNGNGYKGGSLLFSDGVSMYAFTWDHQNIGWKCRQINVVNGIVVTGDDITNIVIPERLRPSGGLARLDDHWCCVVANNSDGTAQINIWHFNDLYDVPTLYLWNGNNAEMVQIDTVGGLSAPGGSSAAHYIPHDPSASGIRTYVPGAPTIVAYNRVEAPGGETVTFRCFGGQTGQVVRLFLGQGGSTPTEQAQLIGGVTGGSAILNGNTIANVDCDGVTDYTVTIQALGIERLDVIEVTGRVSVS